MTETLAALNRYDAVVGIAIVGEPSVARDRAAASVLKLKSNAARRVNADVNHSGASTMPDPKTLKVGDKIRFVSTPDEWNDPSSQYKKMT